MNLADLMERFSTVDAARDYLEKQRWPDGPVCPHCGVIGEATKIQSKPGAKKPLRRGVWKCRGCRKPFTVTVGTIFADSHIPLNKWVIAVHLLCASKKGMSAHQLHRMLGVTYKTAWFMAHRIRYGMSQEPLASKLSGIVEMDEVYIGGKRRYSQPQAVKPGVRAQDRLAPFADKAAVVSILQRDGRVRSTYVDRVTGDNLKSVVESLCAEDAHVITDSSSSAKGLGKLRRHSRVDHSAKEYVRWDDGVCITTNTVEGFFANLRRGIDGTYHHVGRQHLHRYLAEFDFRYNSRKMNDSERREAALKGFDGKRLMLRDPIDKEN